MSFVLRLPLPPSVNAMYRNAQRIGRVKTATYKAWIVEADGYYLLQKKDIRRVSGPCVVQIKVPYTMKGDISNRIKALEDYMVTRELTSDDSLTAKISIERADVVDCVIEVSNASTC